MNNPLPAKSRQRNRSLWFGLLREFGLDCGLQFGPRQTARALLGAVDEERRRSRDAQALHAVLGDLVDLLLHVGVLDAGIDLFARQAGEPAHPLECAVHVGDTELWIPVRLIAKQQLNEVVVLLLG